MRDVATKLCTNCRWFERHVRRDYTPASHDFCMRPLSERRSMVDGKPLDMANRPAEMERNESERCSPEARHFEEKWRPLMWSPFI